MTGRRLLSAALVLAGLLAAHPLGGELRAARPEPPSANRLGTGRLLGGVLAGSFRPLLLNYAWMRADILYGQGRWDELQMLTRSMLALYPHNRRAREFLGWHLAFNLKNEAFDPRLGWRYAREGLDILLEADPGEERPYTDPLVDWFWRQCGQNPLPPLHEMRYAGPAWEAELALRARVRAWAEGHWGEPLTRFEIPLRLLEGRTRWFDRVARAELLRRLVIDEWVRTGASDRYPEAVEAQRWLAGPEGLGDLPGDEPGRLARRAELFAALGRDELPDEVLARAPSVDYDLAITLFAHGAWRRDLRRLGLARAAFELLADGTDAYAKERAMTDAWIGFVEAGGAGDRPDLPFDDAP